jgi:hypothetical protein
MNKVCVLFSGGWDSVAAALKALEKYRNNEIDLVFIDYGQKYFTNEYVAADKFADRMLVKMHVIKMDLKHDIERRNFYLLMEAKRMGYEEIWTGNRNILPIFDKYKDSNWWSLKLFCWLSNIKIKLPVTLWPKRSIVKYVEARYRGIPYNCLKNNTDFTTCDCANCVEMRKVKKIT